MKGKDCEAVKLWRDTFKLNLSLSWKHDVEITVTDIKLWKKILSEWGWRDERGNWHKKHPGIKGLLTEYERQSLDEQMEAHNNGHNNAANLSTRRRKRLSTRRDSDVQKVSIEPPSLYFRTG